MSIPQYISLKEAYEKDVAHGGKSLLTVGKPGVGKTTFLLGSADRLFQNELCIWRGMRSGQEFRFPGPLKVLAYQCRPKFYDMGGNELDVKVTHINTNFDDLLLSCELGKLNAVYFPFEHERGYWVAFSKFLVERFPAKYASAYVSLFVDEVEDLLPAPEEGTTKEVRELLKYIKEFRKVLVSLYCATQQFFDIHWRGLGKLNYRVYLKGGYVSKRDAIIDAGAVHSLPVGAGIFVGSLYQYITFPNYPTSQLIIVRQ